MSIADVLKSALHPEAGEDARLARQAGKDRSAFSQLYQRHYQRVYRYHLARTGNPDDAQDLTSQTFIAALEGIGGFRGEGSFAAWLLSIAHHKMASHYRQMRPQVDLEQAETNMLSGAGPEELADLHVRMANVSAALSAIHPERAEALTLRIFGGLSTAETAAVLGRSQAATKMLVYRALQDLRERLGGEGEEA